MVRASSLRVVGAAILCSAMATVVACAQTKSDAKPTSTAQSASSPDPATPISGKAHPVDEAPSIGSATMKDDGTIVLNLRATDGTGMRGDAQLVYPPSHAQYGEVLKHVGGLKPGEHKPVPPWPD